MKRKVQKFEMTLEEMEILIYILMDWRRLKSELVESADYPNMATTATKLTHFFHSAWEDLHKRQVKLPLDKDDGV